MKANGFNMSHIEAALSVRDASFEVLRKFELTRIFANPGSTEISLLANLPSDLNFTLALHEGSVVGMATGYALARNRPALVIVHTTAGLGNAVGALATARVNRAPLVVIVGQQDRRHLATDPFLAGRLRGLVGEYPVWYNEPVTAQDVPAAIARALHEATAKKGPAIVVVPMDDWLAPFDAGRIFPAPDRVEAPQRSTVDIINEFAESLNNAKNPIIVAGAGNASDEGWDALVKLAEKTQIPVYQESFAARAGFPQDHKLFSGFLSSSRTVLRSQLASHDVILAIGAPVFRQYNFEEGEFFSSTTQVLLVTEDPEEAYRSPVSLALIAHLPSSIAELSRVVKPVFELRSEVPAPREVPPNPSDGEPLRASHVLAVLAGLVAKDSIIVEETPSTRPDMHELLPATNPLGFVSAAMGGLGFGLPAAIGLRLGAPNRPVVAILGDGSSLYGIQGLWSARHYNAGVLFIILNNERYAVMDRLAERVGDGEAPWPAFSEIDFAAMAESFGVVSQRIQTHDELVRILHEVVPTLRERQTPLALIINVEPENKFAP